MRRISGVNPSCEYANKNHSQNHLIVKDIAQNNNYATALQNKMKEKNSTARLAEIIASLNQEFSENFTLGEARSYLLEYNIKNLKSRSKFKVVFSEKEDSKIIELINKNYKYSDIASELNKTASAVQSRYIFLTKNANKLQLSLNQEVTRDKFFVEQEDKKGKIKATLSPMDANSKKKRKAKNHTIKTESSSDDDNECEQALKQQKIVSTISSTQTYSNQQFQHLPPPSHFTIPDNQLTGGLTIDQQLFGDVEFNKDPYNLSQFISPDNPENH